MACAGIASAREVVLSCDDIEQIYVSKGTSYLTGGKTEIFYGASVHVNAGKARLKKAYAECVDGTIQIRIGDQMFDILKADVSTGGNWFGIVRATPQEALDAAMSMCPDKVKSDLDE